MSSKLQQTLRRLAQTTPWDEVEKGARRAWDDLSWLDDLLVVMPFGEIGYSRYHMGLQINPDYGRVITHKKVISQQGSYPHQSANDLVREALKRGDWKRLLFLEHDHEFPPDVFRRHAAATQDIYAGLYVLRDTNNPLPVMFMWDKGRHNAIRPNAVVLNQMLQDRKPWPMDCVPMGCTSIKREVLEAWPKDQPYFSSFTNPQGATISHDVFFCRVAQDNGFDPYIDTSLRVRHYALAPLDDGYFVTWWNQVGGPAAAKEAERFLKIVPPADPTAEPKIMVGHTKDGLKEETAAAVEASGLGVNYVEMQSDESYYVMVASAWGLGETFITVEQDIVPSEGQLQELLDCPEPWCAYAYEYPPFGLYAGMGCTKFSKQLIAALPEALRETGQWSDSKHPPMHWCRVDGWLKQYLTEKGAVQHIHGVVEHLHQGRPAHDCVGQQADEYQLVTVG